MTNHNHTDHDTTDIFDADMMAAASRLQVSEQQARRQQPDMFDDAGRVEPQAIKARNRSISEAATAAGIEPPHKPVPWGEVVETVNDNITTLNPSARVEEGDNDA